VRSTPSTARSRTPPGGYRRARTPPSSGAARSVSPGASSRRPPPDSRRLEVYVRRVRRPLRSPAAAAVPRRRERRRRHRHRRHHAHHTHRLRLDGHGRPRTPGRPTPEDDPRALRHRARRARAPAVSPLDRRRPLVSRPRAALPARPRVDRRAGPPVEAVPGPWPTVDASSGGRAVATDGGET